MDDSYRPGHPVSQIHTFARNVEDFATGDIAENPPLDIPAGLHYLGIELDYPEWELSSLAAEPAWTKKLQSHWEAGERGAQYAAAVCCHP